MTEKSRPVKAQRRLRDVDSANVAFRVKAFAWSLIGLVPMALIGSYVGASTRAPILVTVLFAAAGFCLAFFGSLAVAEGLGRAGSGVFFSSGRSTAGKRAYSLAESLIVRDRIAEAIAELERASHAHPDDADPPVMLARLLRDRCSRPDDAVRWFRTAASRCRHDAGMEIGILREIIEIYTHVLRAPRRALPDLARLASRHPDTAAGKRARSQMAEIRQTMREEDES